MQAPSAGVVPALSVPQQREPLVPSCSLLFPAAPSPFPAPPLSARASRSTEQILQQQKTFRAGFLKLMCNLWKGKRKK
ncbi:hypothetical protein CesoFtcFv8_024529 [Champsocephalus esox]|uniref:Uncharacterized protein n=1 Tax=Champsocephalus esox TaxID=159716 RepID=A0AAN8GIE8_9TELE|nr:hypothetical protein CesoFtcFv8_024529 [Champsocephalus esox]